jgi:hypothetical protein
MMLLMAECAHFHRRLIAKDEALEFAECLDCGEILEAETPPAQTSPPAPSSASALDSPPDGETLSDA